MSNPSAPSDPPAREGRENPPPACGYPSILHLGCGKKKFPGSYGVDCGEHTHADLLWDLDSRPWPLPDNQFERVYMVSVLEHVSDVVGVMEETHRVCRAGAEVKIFAPFASSYHVWTDPTHRRGFTSKSFQYFTEDFAQRHFEYSTARFDIEEVSYNHYEDWFWLYRPRTLDRLLDRWANRHKALYERRFMYWFPMNTVFFRLRARK